MLCSTPYLFVQIDEFLVWQFEGLYSLQHCVPVATVDVRHKTVHRVHGVQGDPTLLLHTQKAVRKLGQFFKVQNFKIYLFVEGTKQTHKERLQMCMQGKANTII